MSVLLMLLYTVYIRQHFDLYNTISNGKNVPTTVYKLVLLFVNSVIVLFIFQKGERNQTR